MENRPWDIMAPARTLDVDLFAELLGWIEEQMDKGMIVLPPGTELVVQPPEANYSKLVLREHVTEIHLDADTT